MTLRPLHVKDYPGAEKIGRLCSFSKIGAHLVFSDPAWRKIVYRTKFDVRLSYLNISSVPVKPFGNANASNQL